MKFIRELVKKKAQQGDDFVEPQLESKVAAATDQVEARPEPTLAKPTLKIKAPSVETSEPAEDPHAHLRVPEEYLDASRQPKTALDSIVATEVQDTPAEAPAAELAQPEPPAAAEPETDDLDLSMGIPEAPVAEEAAPKPEAPAAEQNMWAAGDDAAAQSSEEDNVVAVPMPSAGRARRRSGRVKTRLLGFEHSDGNTEDIFDKEKKVSAAGRSKFPVGWLVVIEGPGTGESFSLQAGVSQIGRGEEEAVALDFGDNSISRNNHAAIAYDEEQTKFFLGHGGKSNIVRLNNKPVLSTEEMSNGDLIRIGETTLQFVALCGETFTWVGKKPSEVVSIS